MKKSERQFTIILIIMGILLLSLFVGIMYYKKSYEKAFFSYNGFDFKRVKNGYEMSIYINEQKTPNVISLRSDPRDLEDIPLDPLVYLLPKKEQIFATINPYDNLTGVTAMAVLELDKIIDNPFLYRIPLNASFTEPYEGKGIGVKTCKDADEKTAVLWLRLEDQTRVYEDNGCLIVAGVKEDDLIRAADRILYTILGIMER